MSMSVAIVGMACQYPDAGSPAELWRNVLAGRRAFRRMPSVRMNPADYLSDDRTTPDTSYVLEAAVIEGYEFDRVRFRVAGGTYRSADLAHWLALDIASRALADAGFPDGDGLPKEGTGVLLGNTLTGEFSRANLMRLRWPYVRRVLERELIEAGWPAARRARFLERMEARYKEPFPPIGEESLAGGLSNTIAGRICNYFDLKGGGYTVDGACASSLLAVANACSALAAGDLEMALAGGVDLSLDPFELIGFAKTGALAPEKMRIYDARSAGFWPGEGCGFVVLMRTEDAVAQGRRIYAEIRGWGISSDGNGGITRPEVEGQLLALKRAYRRAGFGVDSVSYFEGHGTGTNVGDGTELQTLSRARREAGSVVPAVIGSVKAIIGHTKAAAGVAGLIKATLALHHQILPPTTGCETPHAEMSGEAPALRALGAGMIWPEEQPLRAGVSAMGFGGINAHVVLESTVQERRALNPREETLLRSAQDTELFLFGADGAAGLRTSVERLVALTPSLSRAEITDLSEQMAHDLSATRVRAAIIAATPAELTERLVLLLGWLDEGVTRRVDLSRNIFLGGEGREPRIGFLFPGQGSPAHLDGGIMGRRFPVARDRYRLSELPTSGDGISTDIAQPAIVTASMAALRLLERFGVEGAVGLGHSLGELTALHWGGAFDEETLLGIARVRGRAMADLGAPTGAMAGIAAGGEEVSDLIGGDPVVIAGFNSPRQTVISGDAIAVERVIERARAGGLHATRLPVSHAFHSPLVAAAALPLAEALSGWRIVPLRRQVYSTVSGGLLPSNADLRDLLFRQITHPVRFSDALEEAARNLDLLIEVGPGNVLSGLAGSFVDLPVIPTDAGGPSLRGMFQALGAVFALGGDLDHRAIFADRFVRPIDLDRPRRFFENPCELAPDIDRSFEPEHPVDDGEGEWNGASYTTALRDRNGATLNGSALNGATLNGTSGTSISPNGTVTVGLVPGDMAPATESVLELVRGLVAGHAELPVNAVSDDDRLLGDLHLNSITISQIVVEAARHIGLPSPAAPTEFANSTVIEMARALEELRNTGGGGEKPKEKWPAGIEPWVRAFVDRYVALPALPAPRTGTGSWRVLAVPGDPLAESLTARLAAVEGTGVVVIAPEPFGRESVELLLAGARAVGHGSGAFVLVARDGSAGFARTLHLERPSVAVSVVELPPDHPNAVEWIAREAANAGGYTEVRYDAAGERQSPELAMIPLETGGPIPLTGDDLLLVTGGGKGIAAESGLALARETGAWLLLLGRSEPEHDAELSENLARMADAGIRHLYLRADVTDAATVERSIRYGEEALGRKVNAFLHGAGANIPQLIDGLDQAAFDRTLAPKLDGARNVLAAIDPDRLKLFISFSSIIGRTGLRGEADYALANEELSRLTDGWGIEHPACRCLSIEWSIWSGVGMGERLGRVEALLRDGITPITPEIGLATLRNLLATSLPATSVVVSGRFGELPTAKLAEAELPFLRFLEEPRVHYPGLELVAEATLSADTDPYLNDHTFRGQRLFPAVMGLEAFAQAAVALRGGAENGIVFENLRFDRPIIVPDGESTRIRIVALRREDGAIDVALRSEETGFQADHFRARCMPGIDAPASPVLPPGERLPLDPGTEMYGDILFQRGRFKRVEGYRSLSAYQCVAEVRVEPERGWFSQYLPGTLHLGDPGARDASIHAIQGCIPHMTLIPVAVERLAVFGRPAPGSVFVHARERSHEGNSYLYDIEVRDEKGELYERWEGLLLQAVERNRRKGSWGPVLLAPYMERRMGELLPEKRLAVVVENNALGGGKRRGKSNGALRQVAGADATIRRRSDGRPEANGKQVISASHAGDVTMAIAGEGPVGCDLETVVERPLPLWKELLGEERAVLADLIALQTGDGYDVAATRVWGAVESLRKVGSMFDMPIVLESSDSDGWVILSAGSATIATYADRSTDAVGGIVATMIANGDVA
ncbi:MAG: polyketide synthase family protein [Chlorobi bacterium]|nr:polyketide synthase family protein [Chlorobiota bacterium]